MPASVLALDIGGTKIRAGVVDSVAVQDTSDAATVSAVSDVAEVPTRPVEGETVLDRVAELAARYRGHGVGAVGVAAAGVIRDGHVVSATDLIPGWAGSDIAGRIRDTLGVEVTVLGDAHAHGVAEARFGAGRGHDSALVVAVGTGIGGAWVRHGVPAVGEHGVAGHLGHLTHPDAIGLHCSCGRTGHIEAFASGTGIAEGYVRAGGQALTGTEISARASSGEPRAVQVLAAAGHALGSTLGSLANVLDPGIIVMTGSVTGAGGPWWDQLRAGYRTAAMDPVADTALVPGVLGDTAPLLGAAAGATDTAEQPH